MRVPRATYRLQFGPDLGFARARELVPHLAELGVSDVYASPILAARSGSTHGYDVIDPTRLNPELGAAEEFAALADDLRAHEMGLLLDIVPNHMAMSSENPWWMDVLEHGLASRFASTFDIDWRAPGLEGKVLVPILGGPYGELLERGELSLALEAGGLEVHYAEHRFPVDPGTAHLVLGDRLDAFREQQGGRARSYRLLRSLVERSRAIPPRSTTDPEDRRRRWHEGDDLRRDLATAIEADEAIRRFVGENVRAWGSLRGERSVDHLDRLIGAQAYLLSSWRVAPEEVDYRRFFDITDLVAVRAHDESVFEATHGLVLDLVRRGDVTGLRVDHVDGLSDPQGYLERLQGHLGDDAYVVVEKILAREESLPRSWPVAGTTGYEVLNDVNDLFVDAKGFERLEGFTRRFTGERSTFDELARERKRAVMAQLFGAEVASLAFRLQRLAREDRWARDLTRTELARALVEVTASMPVYRSYVRSVAVEPSDRDAILRAVEAAADALPAESGPSLDFLRRVLTLDTPRRRPEVAGRWLAFVMRWQQFTGPVMAKGVEDTALYRFVPLVARDEVGSDPGRRPVTVGEFQARMADRAAGWPHALSATSTHDTKRSEDVRARLDVLAELADGWAETALRWQRWNRPFRREVRGELAPDPTEELLLYQTLVGMWPLRRGEERGVPERARAFMAKAIREGKVHTSWNEPDAAWEAAVDGFVADVLAARNRRFRSDLLRLAETVAWYGMLNGLAQALLKIAVPGVPDLYQGTETWNLRLVDPDNRSTPDFGRVAKALRSLRDVADPAPLLTSWRDGRIKLLVTSRALAARRQGEELFATGDHLGLTGNGQRRDHVVAFARRRGSELAVVIVPRLCVSLASPGVAPVGDVWGRATIALPSDAPARWHDAIGGGEVATRHRTGAPVLRVADALSTLPVALLIGDR